MDYIKVFGIIGIVATLAHMTYYALRPYNMILFFLGFGVIYVVFVLGIKKLKEIRIK